MRLPTLELTAAETAPAFGRARGDLLPRDRVTMSPGAADAGRPGTVPRSDVRWYRPRGEAAWRVALLGAATADARPTATVPGRHAGVASYLRTMQLIA